MKSITISFFFLFSLITSLTLLPSTIAAADAKAGKTNSLELIETVCASTHHKDHCVSSLLSNPDSKNATLPQLGIISVRLASSNAGNTSTYIKKLLANSSSLEPAVEQALQDCSDQYLDATTQLDNSLGALLANDTADVGIWVKAVVADVESCEDGFKQNYTENESLLTKRNKMFRQLCNNALAINKLLSGRKN